ncbi:MAG: baseplate wedge tail fiber connector [Bacilli bacterium]
MANYSQLPKQLIDVGEKGNANTGDIIYDGGVKLNANLDALYNTFGDSRLFESAAGNLTQYLHATGYYQKLPVSYYGSKAVEPGSMHDLDTTSQTFVLNLPNPKRGECVEVINSNGSFSINEIVIKPQSGASILGKTEIRINQGSVRLRFVCIDETPNNAIWDYELSPLFGDFSVPVNKTLELDASASTNIVMFPLENFTGVKLIIAAEEIKAGAKERNVSEVLLMIDVEDKKVYSDEYSILFKVAKLYSVDFSVLNNSIIAAVTNKTPGRIKFSIKSIETIKG